MEYKSYDFQRHVFLDYLKRVLLPDDFEAFLCSNSFDKTVFCLGEKQGMLINDECSCWYNRVGDFLLSVLDRRKEILYGNGQVYKVSQTNPTQECKVNGTECYGG